MSLRRARPRTHRRSSRWRLLAALSVAAMLGCEPKPEAESAGNESEPIYDPTAGGEQRVESVEPAPLSQCRSPRRSAELRVEFRMAVKGNAAERIASEAPGILSLLEAQLCELDPKQDPEGSLRTALGAGLPLEITALTFTRKDASRADARVQLVSSTGAHADGSEAAAELVEPPSWVLKLVRAKDSAWRIASAAPK